ncbi:aminotransferase class IV [Opitutus sp. ER46]|uniref:aminotransferase class IV n=1 Tax=Opitutus sp. ER46 TaxID=2161864 RepID=UPI000D327B27|nr:aminotransferase class IV [Opitutus sp. ER46]PTX96481.1 hypothetical protein DB354_07420 [Opitutus sp. ER46]
MNLITNGQLRPAADGLTALPTGAPGVFETLALVHRTPLLWDEHWARFSAGCRWFGFAAPFTAEAARDYMLALATHNNCPTGVLRYAAWRESSGSVAWQIEVGPPRPHQGKAAFRVRTGPTLPRPTADQAMKHLNRSPWLGALQAARAAGCDETLLLDDQGRLVEGAVSNVLLVAGRTLRTPPLSSGALPGIMRAQVLAFASQLGWSITEADCRPADAHAADEIWLTNALVGIRPVSAYDDTALPEPRPILDAFRRAWIPAYGWDPVLIVPG